MEDHLSIRLGFELQAANLLHLITELTPPILIPGSDGHEDCTKVAQAWLEVAERGGMLNIQSVIATVEGHHGWIRDAIEKLILRITHLEVVRDLVMLKMIHIGHTFIPSPSTYSCVSTASGWSAWTNSEWQSRALPIKGVNFPMVDGKPLKIYRDVLHPQEISKEHNRHEKVKETKNKNKNKGKEPSKIEDDGKTKHKATKEHVHGVYDANKETDENEANLQKFIKTIGSRDEKEGHGEVSEEHWAPQNTNVLFTFFAQWFVEMFLKTGKTWTPDLVNKQFPDTGRTWSSHNIDLSTVYGHNPDRTKYLRSHTDGKLKTQLINGEEYPPFYDETIPGIKEECPMVKFQSYSAGANNEHDKVHQLFLMGHPRQNLHPGVIIINTLFIRMHNILCDKLKARHPNWNDETLFEKARVILTGMILKMVVEDYIQHINPVKKLFNFKFDPELLQLIPKWQFTADHYLEFNILYRWHPLAPEVFLDTPVQETFFHAEWLTDPKRGLKKVLAWSQEAPAHVFGFRSSPTYLDDLTKATLRQNRELRLGSFNDYRMRFGLPAYKSINELAGVVAEHSEGLHHQSTGPSEIASAVRGLYGVKETQDERKEQENMDNVEYYVGLLTEHIAKGSIFGETLTMIVLANAMKGIFANPLVSKTSWRPETFGGKEEFSWVTDISLAKFVQETTEIEGASFEHHRKKKSGGNK